MKCSSLNISNAISSSKGCFKLRILLVEEKKEILQLKDTDQYFLLDADRGELNIRSLKAAFSRIAQA